MKYGLEPFSREKLFLNITGLFAVAFIVLGLFIAVTPDKKVQAESLANEGSIYLLQSQKEGLSAQPRADLREQAYDTLLNSIVLKPQNPHLWVRFSYAAAAKDQDMRLASDALNIAETLRPQFKDVITGHRKSISKTVITGKVKKGNYER